MEKSNLIFNAEKHEYLEEGIRLPSVTEILQEGGFIDLSNVRADVLEAARNFGNAVHKMAELWDKGTLEMLTLDPQLLPYLEGYKKFLKDYDLSFEPDEIEQHLASRVWRYAGTPDRFRKIRKLLIDLKSGTMQPATELQTAAYQILIEENFGIKIKERWGVQLLPGGYKIHPFKDKSDRTIFLGAVNAYYWKQKHNLLKEV